MLLLIEIQKNANRVSKHELIVIARLPNRVTTGPITIIDSNAPDPMQIRDHPSIDGESPMDCLIVGTRAAQEPNDSPLIRNMMEVAPLFGLKGRCLSTGAILNGNADGFAGRRFMH